MNRRQRYSDGLLSTIEVAVKFIAIDSCLYIQGSVSPAEVKRHIASLSKGVASNAAIFAKWRTSSEHSIEALLNKAGELSKQR